MPQSLCLGYRELWRRTSLAALAPAPTPKSSGGFTLRFSNAVTQDSHIIAISRHQLVLLVAKRDPRSAVVDIGAAFKA